MRICIFGNRPNTRAVIEHISKAGWDKCSLVTLSHNSRAVQTVAGFDEKLINKVESFGFEVFRVSDYSLLSINDLEYFKESSFDVGISIGWQRLIPANILNTFKFGIFGWHGSSFRFPNGRGRSPLNWSIRLGQEKIYLNLFKYDTGVDDGQIYSTYEIPVSASDYISDLQDKVLEYSKNSILCLLNDISLNQLVLHKQPEHPFISFPKLSEQSGEIFPKIMDVESTVNLIRSCSRPFPGAFINKETGGYYRIWRAKSYATEQVCCPGYLEFITPKKLVVHLKDGKIVSDDFEILAVSK